MAKKNYNYGRIENGRLVYAPNMLIVTDENGAQVQMFNASSYFYGLQGWLPIIKTEPPEAQEGGYWSPTYSQIDEQIVQGWSFVEYNGNEDSQTTLN